MRFSRQAIFGFVLSFLFVFAADAQAQKLEIHYINVGWGGSVFLRGPDGTTVLLEAGNEGRGTSEVIPYLKSIGVSAAMGLDYTIAGHQHCDHLGGLDEVVSAGYDVHHKNFYNGSTNTSPCVKDWNAASATTSAGVPQAPRPGDEIALGDGAKLTFVAVNGQIIGGGSVAVNEENDRSIAVLVQHGGFDWLWASDLGGGTIDEACTGRYTSTQVDVESAIVQAISPGGTFPLISDGGIDVLHVNHHGSESSTNKNWMNYSEPAVAIISTGAGQSGGWEFPRIDVVEHVLLGGATACITAPPALVLQTEEGSITGPQTSYAGYSVGNIKVVTDGVRDFTVSADGQVNQGPNEVAAAGLPRTFALDDVTPTASTNLTGWKLRQQNATYNYTLPSGTLVPYGGYLIVARSASRAAFESFYKVTLGPNVVFVNSGGVLPVLNGDENFTLYNSGGSQIDGRTINMPAGGGMSLERKSPCKSAGSSASWNIQSSTAATPGRGAGAGCGKGIVINEWSDPPGTGEYAYEYIELYNDK